MIIKFSDREGTIAIHEITNFECSGYGHKLSIYYEDVIITASDAYTEAIIMTNSGTVLERFTRNPLEGEENTGIYAAPWLHVNDNSEDEDFIKQELLDATRRLKEFNNE